MAVELALDDQRASQPQLGMAVVLVGRQLGCVFEQLDKATRIPYALMVFKMNSLLIEEIN